MFWDKQKERMINAQTASANAQAKTAQEIADAKHALAHEMASARAIEKERLDFDRKKHEEDVKLKDRADVSLNEYIELRNENDAMRKKIESLEKALKRLMFPIRDEVERELQHDLKDKVSSTVMPLIYYECNANDVLSMLMNGNFTCETQLLTDNMWVHPEERKVKICAVYKIGKQEILQWKNEN